MFRICYNHAKNKQWVYWRNKITLATITNWNINKHGRIPKGQARKQSRKIYRSVYVTSRFCFYLFEQESVAESIQQLITSPVISSPFYRPFNESLYYLGISWSKKDNLREQARNVINDHVIPAYSRLYHFLMRVCIDEFRVRKGGICLYK